MANREQKKTKKGYPTITPQWSLNNLVIGLEFLTLSASFNEDEHLRDAAFEYTASMDERPVVDLLMYQDTIDLDKILNLSDDNFDKYILSLTTFRDAYQEHKQG